MLFKLASSRSMVRLFGSRIWYSTDPRVRKWLFRYMGSVDQAEFVYVKQGPESYLVHCKDSIISQEVFISGEFEFNKVNAALELINKHTGMKTIDVLVDVGANIGTICIPATKRGLVKRAVAIEPDPANGRLLQINVLLNEMESRITIHACAAGEFSNQSLTLERSGLNSGDHRISVSSENGEFDESAREHIQVPSHRLDGLVQVPANSTMLIWMDTQGYEGFVLKGATALLAAQVPVVMEFWPYGLKRAGSFQTLKESLAHYRGFADLNDSETAGALRPISELDRLFARLDTGKDTSTDILVL